MLLLACMRSTTIRSDPTPIVVSTAYESQPMVMDHQGLGRLDLLGVDQTTQQVSLWKNVDDAARFEV